MKRAVNWVLLRTARYAGVAVAGVTGTGFLYSAVTGNDVFAGSRSSAANLAGWLHVGASVAVIGSCLTLILLAVIAPFRARLTGIQIKLMLLPFFLLPVAFVDLAAATPSVALLLGSLQLGYLIIVPMRRAP